MWHTTDILRVQHNELSCLLPSPTAIMMTVLVSWDFTLTWEFFSSTALGPTQPPIKWVPGALSLGVKRPGREADHSPPTSAEDKNAWSYTSTPPIRLRGVVFSQAQGQLYQKTSLSRIRYPGLYRLNLGWEISSSHGYKEMRQRNRHAPHGLRCS
jgi:hypothetical protein